MRDLVQHLGLGCNIQHASMLFSKIVSLIRVFLVCWAGNRQYYVVIGFAKNEHITAWSTSYMCTNVRPAVNVSKNVIYLSRCFLKFRLVGSSAVLRDMTMHWWRLLERVSISVLPAGRGPARVRFL